MYATTKTKPVKRWGQKWCDNCEYYCEVDSKNSVLGRCVQGNGEVLTVSRYKPACSSFVKLEFIELE